jgi:hypothetical protein
MGDKMTDDAVMEALREAMNAELQMGRQGQGHRTYSFGRAYSSCDSGHRVDAVLDDGHLV